MGEARSGRGVSQELWARVAWDVVNLARSAGVDVWAACAGLSFDPESVRRLRRVSWDDYCTLSERVAEGVGGLEALARLSENRYHDTTPELTTIAAALVGPKTLYRLLYEVFNPVIFPMVAFSYEDLGTTRIHVEAWLRAGTRPCLALHHGVLGAMRGLPKHLGLPSATVTGETAADHVAWDIEVPASRTLVARAGRLSNRIVARARATAVVLGSESDGTPVSIGVGPTTFDSPKARIEDAELRWKLDHASRRSCGGSQRARATRRSRSSWVARRTPSSCT